jgi:hypothetical protein
MRTGKRAREENRRPKPKPIPNPIILTGDALHEWVADDDVLGVHEAHLLHHAIARRINLLPMRTGKTNNTKIEVTKIYKVVEKEKRKKKRKGNGTRHASGVVIGGILSCAVKESVS